MTRTTKEEAHLVGKMIIRCEHRCERAHNSSIRRKEKRRGVPREKKKMPMVKWKGTKMICSSRKSHRRAIFRRKRRCTSSENGEEENGDDQEVINLVEEMEKEGNHQKAEESRGQWNHEGTSYQKPQPFP